MRHKKTSFNPVVLTQTLSLLANVLPHGCMFAHYGFSHVTTVLLFSPNTVFLPGKLSLRATE